MRCFTLLLPRVSCVLLLMLSPVAWAQSASPETSGIPASAELPAPDPALSTPEIRVAGEPVPAAEAVALPAVESEMQAPTSVPPRAQTLDELFKQREANYGDFRSLSYFIKLAGVLTLLLGGFYVVARLIRSRILGEVPVTPPKVTRPASQPRASVPVSSALSRQSLSVSQPQSSQARPQNTGGLTAMLKSLFPLAEHPDYNPYRPVVLSKSRLGPTKELHVVQVGDKRLLIGSTPNQLVTLADLSDPQVESFVADSDRSEALRRSHADEPLPPLPELDPEVYRKYLNKPHAQSSGRPAGQRPQPDDVVMLDDYEDQFERL